MLKNDKFYLARSDKWHTSIFLSVVDTQENKSYRDVDYNQTYQTPYAMGHIVSRFVSIFYHNLFRLCHLSNEE